MLTDVIIFEVGICRYGLPVTDVRELVRAPSIVPLPKAPAIIEGIINVRGSVMPVLDIRKRFGLASKASHPADHMIVAHAGPRLVALRIDRALDIAQVDPQDIDDAKAITPRSEYVAGVAKLADGLVLIHDLRTFLTEAEARDVDGALDDTVLRSP
jgi:purine-binding chemotaxis protein CheW